MLTNLQVRPSGLAAIRAQFSADRSARPESINPANTLLMIDKSTGALTYGQERMPLKPWRLFAVPPHGFWYGYLVWQGRKPIERHMTFLGSGRAIPEIPGGEEAIYPADGPRYAAELMLASIDEPGFNLTLVASPSSAKRMDALAKEVDEQMQSPEGEAGFICPVIQVGSQSYVSDKYGLIWCFAYRLTDWLDPSKPKTTLLSETASIQGAAGDASDAARAATAGEDLLD